MANIVPVAILVLMFFTYVINSSDWGLNVMKADMDVLNTHTKEYKEQTEALYNPENIVIGKLD